MSKKAHRLRTRLTQERRTTARLRQRVADLEKSLDVIVMQCVPMWQVVEVMLSDGRKVHHSWRRGAVVEEI